MNEVWKEYQKGVAYKNSIDLYEKVEQNESFYIGDQWKGLNAPNLTKPTMNIMKRVVSYFIAMLVADDISIKVDPVEISDVIQTEVEKVWKRTKYRAKNRDVLRNAAVDGDGCIYFWYDTDEVSGSEVSGGIKADVIDNTSLYFGDPFTTETQTQPYIIIARRELVESVKKRAKEPELVTPDSEKDSSEYELCTVLIKLWKDGTVKAIECTKDAIIRDEWDTRLSLYPVAYFPWEKVKDSCHGQSVITGLIPNQISINKLFAMSIRSVEDTAFPKIIYDRSKIPRWTNRVGEAIGVPGDVDKAVATSFKAQDMSYQVTGIIQSLVSMTRDFMGASDAALGNVTPENTSAIIAVQQASAIPLELQKLSFYQYIEECVYIVIDFFRAYYGVRMVNGVPFDFSSIPYVDVYVDVGASSYWSEITESRTLDNILNAGLVDLPTYLDLIPDKMAPFKKRIEGAVARKQIGFDGGMNGRI